MGLQGANTFEHFACELASDPPLSRCAAAAAAAVDIVVFDFLRLVLPVLVPCVGKCCDEGKSFIDAIPDSPATTAFVDIVSSEYCNRQPLHHWGLVRFCTR